MSSWHAGMREFTRTYESSHAIAPRRAGALIDHGPVSGTRTRPHDPAHVFQSVELSRPFNAMGMIRLDRATWSTATAS